MGRYYSYINTSLNILRGYNGEMPFSIFIKQFFSKEKKYGSRDRKQIAALCYSYFRVGHALNRQISEENLLAAFFIVNTGTSLLVQNLQPGWNDAVNKPAEEKIKLTAAASGIENIFPFTSLLNDTININSFCRSFIIQPSLFVRIRPHNKKAVIEKIKAAGTDHALLNDDNCAAFPPGINIDNFLLPDKEVVVQDYNSQQVLNFIKYVSPFTASQKGPAVWDCCAASGGKSILIYDLLDEKIQLTVSDIRQSILANLQQRFKNAGIKNYHHFVADISNSEKTLPAASYDLIICDAPCTGSGTWSRTPEQLYFFNPASVDEYAARQKKIAANVLPHLKPNGLFFYITCSVFKKENEEVAEHIGKQPGMKLMEMKNLFGYEIKADSMFVAVFKKVLK